MRGVRKLSTGIVSKISTYSYRVLLSAGYESMDDARVFEFLDLYIAGTEAQDLKTSLQNIVLMHWAKPVLETYSQQGVKMGGEVVRPSVRILEGGIVEVPLESFMQETEHLTKQGNISFSQAQTSVEESPFSFVVQDSSYFEQLDHLEVKFVGGLYLGCWQYVAEGGIDSDNRLAFVVRPTDFNVVQRDDTVVKIQAESDSVLVQFFGAQHMGISRLSITDGFARREFIDTMKMEFPSDYKLLVQVFLDLFRVGQGLSYLERNTCVLDQRASDIEIGMYCKAEQLLLYSNDDLSNRNLVTVGLKGATLQKSVGELMAKCYGVVLPSATIVRQSQAHKWECERNHGMFLMVDKGPLQKAPATLSATAVIQKPVVQASVRKVGEVS